MQLGVKHQNQQTIVRADFSGAKKLVTKFNKFLKFFKKGLAILKDICYNLKNVIKCGVFKK